MEHQKDRRGRRDRPGRPPRRRRAARARPRGRRHLARHWRRRHHRRGARRGAGGRRRRHRRRHRALARPGRGDRVLHHRGAQPAGRRPRAPASARIVVVSIIGIDRFRGGYNAAKLAHERLTLGGPIPARDPARRPVPRVRRAADGVGARRATWPTCRAMRTQLVAARSVAEALVDLAVAEDRRGRPDLGGRRARARSAWSRWHGCSPPAPAPRVRVEEGATRPTPTPPLYATGALAAGPGRPARRPDVRRVARGRPVGLSLPPGARAPRLRAWRRPEVRYARSGDVSIAYAILGEGRSTSSSSPAGCCRSSSRPGTGPPADTLERLASFCAPDPVRQARHRPLRPGHAASPTSRPAWTTSAPSWTPPGPSGPRSSASPRAVRMALLFAATYPERTAAAGPLRHQAPPSCGRRTTRGRRRPRNGAR